MPKQMLTLNGSVRYGVTRNVPATDAQGRAVLIAMAVVERENGAFQTLAIPEAQITFAGEGIIEDAVRRTFVL
jgi:hypothetical protein